MNPRSSTFTITDMFCGAGGSSTGAARAGADVRLAINHWARAIETHNTNHPDTEHVLTDISTSDPRGFRTTDALIASPSCTFHSQARGEKRKQAGQLSLFEQKAPDPTAEKSRATMWDVVRFAEYHNYNAVVVENVVEVRKWPPFDAWLKAMHSLGYQHKIVYFNSMFAHPTPQSRDRIYIVFWKKGNKRPNLDITPRAWCQRCETDIFAHQAWKNPDKQWGRYGARAQYVYVCPRCGTAVQPYYYAAANAIDWSDPGERIGDREKPLKARTLERIQYGLKHFAGPFVQRYDGTHQHEMSSALYTQTARDATSLVLPFTVETTYTHAGERRVRSTVEAMNTQSTRQSLGVVFPFIVEFWGTSTVRSTNEALSVVEAGGGHHGLVTNGFLINSAGNLVPRAPTDPLPTQPTSRSPFLVSYYGSDAGAHAVTDALGTVPTVDRHALVQPGDLPRVEDCYFRMLKPSEIQRAMAFPDDYVVTGNSREQIKQLGNAVTPPVMELLMQRVMATFQ